MKNLLGAFFNRKSKPFYKANHNISTRFFNTSQNLEYFTDLTLESVFPHLIVSNFTSIVESNEKMWVATSMLTRFLDSITDDLVIMQNGKIFGTIGWREILTPLLDNPTSSFFFNTTAGENANKDILRVFTDTKMKKFIHEMYKTRRESAILQTYDNTFSSISSKSILEIGLQLDSSIKVSDLPHRRSTNFFHDDTIELIIKSMLRNDSSVLILENTSSFLSAQIIFEKIVNDLKYLHQAENFLDLSTSEFKLKNTKIISHNTSVVEMCKIMLNMRHPFVMTSDRLLTPKDVVGALKNYGISKNL